MGMRNESIDPKSLENAPRHFTGAVWTCAKQQQWQQHELVMIDPKQDPGRMRESKGATREELKTQSSKEEWDEMLAYSNACFL